MTDQIANTPAEPDGAPRIAVLDILRGVAILGILFMNINDMGQSIAASFDDVRHLGWSSADQVAWWLREVLANGTARCLLEMLFGAGMVILTERAARAAGARQVMRGYYVRNLILFGFGLVHIFILLWPGDILHSYGLAALVAFLFRRLPPRWLIAIGLIAAVSQLGGAGYFGYYRVQHRQTQIAAIEAKQRAGIPLTSEDRVVQQKVAKQIAERTKARAELAADIRAEDRARSGTAWTWAKAAWTFIIDFESRGIELLIVWEAASVMLIGAALFKLGILQGRRSRRFYIGMTLAAYAVGLTLRTYGAWETTRFGDGPQTIWATYEIARLTTTLGHLGLINLVVSSALGARLMRPFAAAGRTALTVYILQTLICLWVIFPPFGLALYGHLTWAPLMLLALGIDAVLLVAATLYVRRYDMAPVEWAWRSLVERRLLPWRAVPA